jgi:hypothetical protein
VAVPLGGSEELEFVKREFAAAGALCATLRGICVDCHRAD